MCVLLSRPFNNRECSEHLNKQGDDQSRRGHRRVPQRQCQAEGHGGGEMRSLVGNYIICNFNVPMMILISKRLFIICSAPLCSTY